MNRTRTINQDVLHAVGLLASAVSLAGLDFNTTRECAGSLHES
jgi:hypothetical protein